MKKMLVFALLLAVVFPSFAQQSARYDTVYVNTDATTYLIFDDAITLFNLGNIDYQAKADNPKMLFVRAKTTLAKPSTIVVTYGEEIYTAYLAYRKNAQAFYDFRKTKVSKEPITETPQDLERKQMETKLRKVNNLSSNIFFMAEKQDILAKLLNLYNDHTATYLKFSLKNQSSIVYDLDYVSFAYVEKRTHKQKKLNTVNSGFLEVEPLVKIEKILTKSNETNEYFYALPLYSTTEDGHLQVIFREKNGLRSVTFEIPFKKILNAAFLN